MSMKHQISLPHWNKDDEESKPQKPQPSVEDVTNKCAIETCGAATILSCTINLANTIVGAGMLGLPGAFGGTGWLGGMLLLLIGAAFSCHGLILLAKSAMKVSIYPSSFYTIAHTAVPKYTILIDLAVALKCFGVATGYLITCGDCMVGAIEALLSLQTDGDKSTSAIVSAVSSRQFWIVGAVISVLPVSFFQSFDSLKHASTAALFFVFLLAAVIVAYAHGLADPCEGFDGNVNGDDICRGDVVPFTNVPSTLEKLPIFIFSFTCHQNIFPIVNEIRPPRSLQRIGTSVLAAIGFALLVFLLVAFEGYSTYGSNVKGDILLNYPETFNVTIMRICIAFMLTLHYPLQLDPSRRCILSLIKEIQNWVKYRRRKYAQGEMASPEVSSIRSYGGVQQSYKSSAIARSDLDTSDECLVGESSNLLSHNKDHSDEPTGKATIERDTSFYIVTFGFLSLSFALAIVVTDLGVVLALVGATGSTLVSYVLPGLIYVKINESFDLSKGFAYLQLMVGCLVMPVALYFVLQGAVAHR